MATLLSRPFWKPELALDLGTATTRLAAGMQAVMTTPSVAGERPVLRSGVVVDSEAAVAIIEPLMAKARGLGIRRPRVVVCAPSDANSEERERLVESVAHAGASDVYLVPEPLAAAIGAGVEVASPYAQMIVDIGEGVTDCAILRSGKILQTAAVRVGCDKLREKVMSAAPGWGLRLAKDAAEELVRQAGVRASSGRATAPGVAYAHWVQEAMEPVVQKMLTTVTSLLRDVPDDIGCEIIESGICLTGGGSLLPGMRERLESETKITTVSAHNPFDAVVEGARAMLPIVTSLNQWKH